MKIESKIAEENIKRIEDEFDSEMTARCQEHKQTCQRWLKFLEDNFSIMGFEKSCEMCQIHKRQLQEGVIKQKIQDLKTAIKLYEEAGI